MGRPNYIIGVKFFVSGSQTLEILNLAFNEITSAALDSSYAALTSLRYFDLSRNDIRALGGSDLDPLRGLGLEALSLADCGLVSLAPRALRGLGNLTALTLSRSLLNHSVLEQVGLIWFNSSFGKRCFLRSTSGDGTSSPIASADGR